MKVIYSYYGGRKKVWHSLTWENALDRAWLCFRIEKVAKLPAQIYETNKMVLRTLLGLPTSNARLERLHLSLRGWP